MNPAPPVCGEFLFCEVDQMSSDREILLAKEAANELRISLQRLYELCRTDSSFPKIVVGRRQYRFARRALERWLETGGSKQEGNDE